MDEINFRSWLLNKKVNPKVIGDTISRLKRLERELNQCDIDEEYRVDGCKRIFSALDKNGENEIMRGFKQVNLPIGKYYMSAFRYALKKYLAFVEERGLHNS